MHAPSQSRSGRMFINTLFGKYWNKGLQKAMVIKGM